MKRSTIFYAALVLCLLSGALTVFLVYRYSTVLQERRDQAHTFGQQQATVLQQRLNENFTAQKAQVDAIAADLSSGALSYADLFERLRAGVNNPQFKMYTLGAAFQPQKYQSKELFGPYYRRNAEGGFDRKQLEETYIYTNAAASENDWYVHTVQSRQANWYVFYDRVAAVTVVKYVVPFFTPASDSTEAAGVIYVEFSVDDIKELIRSVDVGEEGYATLVAADGTLVIYPKVDLLMLKTIAAISQEYNLPELLTEHQRALKGEFFDTSSKEIGTSRNVWRFYRPLVSEGWSLSVVSKQIAKGLTAEVSLRYLLQISWAAMAFVFFLVAVVSRVERASLRRLWGFSISTALILLAGIVWIWVITSQNPLRNLLEDVLVNPANVNNSLAAVDQAADQLGRDRPTRIPTGLLIKTIQVDPSGASVSGYIWQKYPRDLPDSVTRGVRFPDDLSGATISEVYRFTSGNTQTIGWFFIANIKQSFDLSKYPLDQANVQIKVWPRELNHNLVFVPDFVSYDFMAPTEKPGLAQTLRMAGWTINRSYFSYATESFNTDLGSATALQRNTLPSLTFNVNATRNLLSPLIAYCITAIVVSSMLFGIQLVNIETPYNALSNASALFFVVAITHVGLRSALNASGVVYLEYIFIMQYVYILGGAINGMLYYSDKSGKTWIHYEHNLIPKIGYWPTFLSVLLVISTLIFYPVVTSVPDETLPLPTEAVMASPVAATATSAATSAVAVTPSAPSLNMTTLPAQQIVITDQSVTLRYPIYANPTTFDPSLSNRYDSTEQIGNLFMGLTRLDPVTLEVQPALATSWSASVDGLTWLFQLRSDVPWVEFAPKADGSGGVVNQVLDLDGRPRYVTAYDVEYGIRRALTSGNSSAANLNLIKNADEVIKGTAAPETLGVVALNATTVQFTLKSAGSYFPELLAYDVSYAVPSWAINNWADDWTKPGNINTNGPYLLSAFEKDQRVQLIKNPLWPEAANVQIEVIEEPILPDAQMVVDLYLKDGLDTLSNPSDALLKTIKANALITPDLSTYPLLCTQYIGFVNKKTPFDDARLRRAFSAAIDRDFIANQILKDGSTPARVFSPPGVFGAVTDPALGQGYDPELAKTLFNQYLTDYGFTVAEFNNTYKLTFGQLSTGDAVNQAIVSSWRRVLGVEVQLVTAPNDDLSKYDRKTVPLDTAFHMFQGNWCADYPDQDNFIRGLFNSQNGSNNVRRNCVDIYCSSVNPDNEFDRITNAAASTTDSEQRKQDYARAEQILAVEEAAYAPVFFASGSAVKKPWLTRNYPAFGAPDFFNWTIDTNAQVKP